MWNVPDQGTNLCPLQWKHGVLTTGLQGKSAFNNLDKYIHCITPGINAKL